MDTQIIINDILSHKTQWECLRNDYKDKLTPKEVMEIYTEIVLKGEHFANLTHIFPVKERRAENGTWGYIPFYPGKFIELLSNLIKNYNIKSFIDIGAGYGDKVNLAHKLGLKSSGIEYKKEYVDMARKMGVKIIHANAFKFNRFCNYDLIYMYHPIWQIELYSKLVENCFRKMKVGGYFVEVYQCELTHEVFKKLKNELNLKIYKLNNEHHEIFEFYDTILIRKENSL
jgi:SAM-dependent methyltransferase